MLTEATKVVVLEALESKRKRTIEMESLHDCLVGASYTAEQLAAIDAAITEVKAAGEWRPVADGEYKTLTSLRIGAYGNSLNYLFGGGYFAIAELPDHIRLCEYIGSQEGRNE